MALISFMPHIPPMQRIIIDHFGPIKHLDLEIKDLTILIGPNAGGKSLVGKLVWFFEKLGIQVFSTSSINAVFKVLQDAELSAQELKSIEKEFSQEVLRSFEYYFHVANVTPFRIDYHHEKWGLLSIKSSGNRKFDLEIEATHWIKKATDLFASIPIDEVFGENANLFKEVFKSNEFQKSEIGASMRKFLPLQLEESLQNLKDNLYFVPAGRMTLSVMGPILRNRVFGALSILSSDAKDTQKVYFDPFINEYTERRDRYQSQLAKHGIASLEDLKRVFPETEPRLFDLFLENVKKILKVSDVAFNSEQETFLVTDKGTKVPLSIGSSGQQEAIGILISLMESIQASVSLQVFVEEPEAHLYPSAQQHMANALSLAFNATKRNKMLINTHSPYVLTAFNNLLFAHKVGQHFELAEQVAEQIPREYWLDPSRVAAYHLGESEGGQELIPLMTEQGVINAEEIDDASDAIGDEFDALMNMYRKSTARGNA